LNFERIRYWLGRGAVTSEPVAELLGKALETVLFGALKFVSKQNNI
jgi:ribosomal protein S16